MAPVTPTHKKENLKFGKVEFAETSTRAILRNPDAALSSANNSINNNNISKRKRGPVDVKGQLQQALNKKKKFETLQSKDAEKASSILETQKWSKVEALAAGDKIKDDISLLKKSVKKKEAMKKKSAAVWDKRVETVKKQGLDRQKKRNENLQARKNDKRSGKNKGGKKSVGAMEAKKAKAKKAARPGFEGGKKKVKSKK